MPTTIRQMLNRFQAVNMDILIVDAINTTKDAIVTYNRRNLYDGLTINGTPLKAYKEPEYAKYKLELNPKGVTDLYVTGMFYRGIGVVVGAKSITTSSSDEKAPRLELEYGSAIYGLPLKYKPDYVKITQKVLLQKVKDQTVGG